MVRTSDFQSGNPGSIPGGAICIFTMSLEKILKVSPKIMNLKGEEVNCLLISEEKSQPKPQEKKSKISLEKEGKEEWLAESASGQLIVDIYEKEDKLIIFSTIAGLKSEDIDVTVEPDLIIIRGERKKQAPPDSICHRQECFWGKFSRTLVLPCPVKPDKVDASLKNGVLKIVLPKAEDLSQGVEVKH